MSKKRVVITGMGTVNPLGNNVAQTWQTILNKQSGITNITKFDTENLSVKIAGEVKDFDYTQYFEGDMLKKAKRMDSFCHYAVAAMAEAAEQSGIETVPNKERIGVTLGSGIGGLQVQHDNSTAMAMKGPRRVSPFYIPMSIGNMAAGVVSILYGLKGPNFSLQTACATANHSIATGTMLIQNDMADMIVAGGSEGALLDISIAGFGNMRALSTRNEDPLTASRPYDTDRDGFVLSEGAAVLILEDYEHAVKRNAPIIAEVLSCGMSGDAYDFVQPDPEGKGAFIAMREAMRLAQLNPEDLGYINTHGTSTPLGDIAEAEGVAKLLGSAVDKCYVGSTKSYHGHLLGATSGVEAVITSLAIQNGIIPANINIFNRDPKLPPILLPQDIIEKPIKAALSNSFGFGGHNSSLILGKV
ncbi:beta-ketoacyl-ACP synthase II [Spirochaeta cellobiosiphila]|uniref:beta-ketoacyl-ACP synthase II n=1 Tax=Spirochaeta cellobiosiphila TaxID=504483 RepID=UPI0003F5D473|nr:beta-ketoacyl-ACP synthase II [Spirochaeta cellobiosiphila]